MNYKDPKQENSSSSKQPGSLTDRTISGLMWSFSGAGVQAVFKIIVVGILARYLTPNDFGLVAIAFIVINLADVFSQLGMGPSIVQIPHLSASHLRTAFTVSLIFGVLIGAIVYSLAPFLAYFFKTDKIIPVVHALAIIFPVQGFAVVSQGLMQRELKFRNMALIETFSYVIGYGLVGVLLAISNFGVWALLIATISRATLRSGLFVFFQKHPKKLQVQRNAARDLIYLGGGLTLSKFCGYFARQGDYLVVGRWLGTSSLGLYERAYTLMDMSNTLFASILNKVLFPSMAKVQTDSERLTDAYCKGVALVALVMCPVSSVLYILAPEIINVLLGPSWSEAVLPFRILTLGMLFRTGFKVSAVVSRAKGAVYGLAWRQGVYALLVVTGSLLGVRFGIKGVACAVLLALAIHFILMAGLAIKLTLLTWTKFFAIHLNAIFVAILFGAEIFGITYIMRAFNLLPIVTIICSIFVILLSSILLIRFFPKITLGENGIWIKNALLNFFGNKQK